MWGKAREGKGNLIMDSKEIWYGSTKFRYSFFQSQGKKIDDATSLMLIDLLPA